MQTILGAGGAIALELAKSLAAFTKDIRLVSRNPKKVNDDDQLLSADLTNASEVDKAVEGSEIVYLTVGLIYNTKIWESTWPVIMQNVIQACKNHQARLVFFDNIYMYDPNSLGLITEENPINPSSKKGKVRAKIAEALMNAVDKGEIQGLIARSADFYGPGKLKISMLTQTVFEPLHNRKKASVLGGVDFKHSFTYTPDAGKSTALLGNSPDAFGQVWHLPTTDAPLTLRELINHTAQAMGTNPKYQVAGKSLTKVIGLFSPIMKELSEMMYQYDRDYIFSSEKFEKRFDLPPASYEDGLAEIFKLDYGIDWSPKPS